jgi:uncharacterized protein
MIILLSPSKTLDFQKLSNSSYHSEPVFKKESQTIIKVLQKKSPESFMSMMGISKNLAMLNVGRYKQWETENASVKEAVFAFKGDVYTGLDAETMSETDLEFAQRHLRILSGLYGWLRPFDQIQAHRLEMGTKLAVGKHENLYSFWQKKVTAQLLTELNQLNSDLIINLASNEYFHVIGNKLPGIQLVSPVFKEYKNGEYKIVSFFAKKARGLMASFIIRNQIKQPEDLIAFDLEGYHFNAGLSTPESPVFTRG